MAQSINLKNSNENSILIVNGTRVYLIVGLEICFQMTTALNAIANCTTYKWKKSLYLNMTYSWLYMSCWHLEISWMPLYIVLRKSTFCQKLQCRCSGYCWIISFESKIFESGSKIFHNAGPDPTKTPGSAVSRAHNLDLH